MSVADECERSIRMPGVRIGLVYCGGDTVDISCEILRVSLTLMGSGMLWEAFIRQYRVIML